MHFCAKHSFNIILMRNFYTILLLMVTFLTASSGFAQGVISGMVTDQELNEPLPGANVTVKGQSVGTSTDFDGRFTLEVDANSGVLVISYIGFVTQEVRYTMTGNTLDLGTITLASDAQELEGVVVTGVMDIAKDRQTPVAVSTIRAEDIQDKLGSQEFPEILRSTPSIYVTKQGGGFGDSRINIRGFDTQNSAVMINGVPVNDMENGIVYWSNWAGLSDVTSAMQVQRGLGSSKLAISSVGGTINVLTRSADRSEGGVISSTFGNDGYLKLLASYNTGKMENGFSSSVLLSRTAGDGYVDGTEFEGYNYFLAFGYQPNDRHNWQLTVTGAPQQHNQRSFAPTINDYIRFNNGTDPDIRYNSDWGYRNGKEFTFGGNFYHKPIASMNWDWNISDNSSLSTVLYASWGRGGSIGSIGRINGNQSFSSALKTPDGLIRVDDIFAWNQGQNVPDFGVPRETFTFGGDLANQGLFVNGSNNTAPSYTGIDDGGWVRGPENGISQRSSVNSHNWYGAIINFNNEINENWSWDLGVDLRTYKGYHYRRLVDLMGADAYMDNDDINNPLRFLNETYAPTISNTLNVFKNIDDEEKIDYYNLGFVKWLGAFGQLEYTNDKISAFIQGSISSQGFKREDPFTYLDSDSQQTTKWVNKTGGNIKGGINYNINEQHNVFFNTGYYQKQPLFDAVFLNFSNTINPELTNEKIFGLELGYGFRSQFINANVNLYRTSWKDRFVSDSYSRLDQAGNVVFQGSVNYTGVEQVHSGIEVDFLARPMPDLSVTGMLSVGNWEYAGNPSGVVLDFNNNPVGDANLILDGVKVGDAAQFTSQLGVQYDLWERLKLDANWFHADNLYADFTPEDFVDEDADGNADSDFLLKLPAYDLVDLGITYKLMLGNQGNNALSFRFNVNNVFGEEYISESETNSAPSDDPTANWNGINRFNRVFFGFGRTWNLSIRYNF